MSATAMPQRNLTPPEIAEQFRVSTNKVIAWIRSGELRALYLASRGCKRPRYSVTPEDLEAFKRSRQVVADAAPTPRRPRSSRPANVREFV
jgi:hypothetical protein